MIEFAAVIAYTGTVTRGGWCLEHLMEDEPVPVTRRLPLPLSGMAQRGHGRIGWVDHLAYFADRSAVVARGFLNNTPIGRDYAGALRLKLTRIVMEGETLNWEYGDGPDGLPKGPVVCSQWRVGGATVQEAPAWDLPVPQIEIRGLM